MSRASSTAALPPVRVEMGAVTNRVGATVALRGVDLALRRGEIHGLLGENGAGEARL